MRLTHGAKSDDPVERSPKLCLGDIRFDQLDIRH